MTQNGPAPSRPERRATMRDVARRAGVSVMTVSRVVNDSARVDPETRSRVEAAITSLGYRQNAAASSLRRLGSASLSVGLVVDDVANPFCSALTAGVERVCRDRGHLLLSGSSASDAHIERALVEAFLTRRVDGLIVMRAGEDHSYLAEEARRGVPIVFVDRAAAGFDADTVASDNLGAARIATTHLVRHGHRRIALLGDRLQFATAQRRRDGFHEALCEAGIEPDPALEQFGLSDAAAAQDAFGRLLDSPHPPSAVFAAQNLVTIGALRALHERQLQRAVALVGFDDVELAALLDPPVTVMAQDPVRIGATAAELLFERLTGLTGPPRHVAVPAVLVPRGSGEMPPASAR